MSDWAAGVFDLGPGGFIGLAFGLGFFACCCSCSPWVMRKEKIKEDKRRKMYQDDGEQVMATVIEKKTWVQHAPIGSDTGDERKYRVIFEVQAAVGQPPQLQRIRKTLGESADGSSCGELEKKIFDRVEPQGTETSVTHMAKLTGGE